MKKILITGGTGLIGKHLQQLLVQKKYAVSILTRTPKHEHEFRWDVAKGYVDPNAFKEVTHIVHLAGAGIADKKWTAARKQEILDSRVVSTKLLFDKVQEYNIPLQGFIGASGIGYYGSVTSEETYTEASPPEKDYISEVCVQWEKALLAFKELQIPTTILRTGIVLASTGGALAKMNTPLFLSVIGSGKQYMPWIHIEDMSQLYLKAIKDSDFTGIYNAVAPEHQTNRSFTKTLGKTLGKPVFPLAVPAFILQLVLGELSSLVLNGSKVSSEKVASVHQFRYKTLTTALQNLLTK